MTCRKDYKSISILTAGLFHMQAKKLHG